MGPDTPACPWREDTQAPPTTRRQKLWFLLVFKSVLEEAAQKGKQGAASQGSRGVGAGSLEKGCQVQMPTTCNAQSKEAETPQAPQPLAGTTLGGGDRNGPLLTPQEGQHEGGTPRLGGEREARRTERNPERTRETEGQRQRETGVALTHFGGERVSSGPHGVPCPSQEETPR